MPIEDAVREGVELTEFIESMENMIERIDKWAEAKGWNSDDPVRRQAPPAEIANFDCTKIALMHTELSEAVEGIRAGNPPSEHIPEFTAVEEELADVAIRIMHFAALRGVRLGDAIVAKLAFNWGREYRHGKLC